MRVHSRSSSDNSLLLYNEGSFREGEWVSRFCICVGPILCYLAGEGMSRVVKPTGQVPVPLLIFGSVSLLLGMAAEVVGIFDGVTESLRGVWQSGGLTIQAEMGMPGMVGLLLGMVGTFGLAGAILGSPGAGRRMVLGFTGLFLSLSLIPAFAVWGIFWKPFGVVLAVAWSWFSAMIYAQTHQMPCEGVEVTEAGNVISLARDREESKSQDRVNGKS